MIHYISLIICERIIAHEVLFYLKNWEEYGKDGFGEKRQWEYEIKQAKSLFYCFSHHMNSYSINRWEISRVMGKKEASFERTDWFSTFWKNFSSYLANTSQAIHKSYIFFLCEPLLMLLLRYIRLDLLHSWDFWMYTVGDVWQMAIWAFFAFSALPSTPNVIKALKYDESISILHETKKKQNKIKIKPTNEPKITKIGQLFKDKCL